MFQLFGWGFLCFFFILVCGDCFGLFVFILVPSLVAASHASFKNTNKSMEKKGVTNGVLVVC